MQRRPLSPAEERVDELAARRELGRGPLHPQLAADEHIGAVGDLKDRFRTLLEGATGVGKWDLNRRQLDVLQLAKEIFDIGRASSRLC